MSTSTLEVKKITGLPRMVIMAMLIALLIIMTFTPIGYLYIGAIEITLMSIPVAVGAILLGPAAGAVLGLVFGLTSFFQCFGMSAFGATLLAINPFYTFIMCVIPRILVGVVPGLIFKGLQKIDKTKVISYAVASLSAAVTNTVLFVLALIVLFWNTDYIQGMAAGANIFAFFVAFIGLNGIVEASVCLVIATAVTKALAAALRKQVK